MSFLAPPSFFSSLVSRTLLFTCRAAFEIVALAAARLGSVPLAAQSVIMTTDQSGVPIFRRVRTY